MKKFALPLLVGLILSAFVFTGCDNGETLIAPEDTWCWIKKDIAGQELAFYLYYTSDTDTITYDTDKTLELVPGLTVVVSKDIDTTVLDTSVWTYKSFPLNAEVTLDETEDTDDTETKNKAEFKSGYWDALYVNYYKEFKTQNFTTTPKVITKGINASSLEELSESTTEKLSWKKITKSLLSKLLDD